MDKKIKFEGGDPRMGLTDFLLTADSNRDFIHSLFKECATDFIISGCEVTENVGSIDVAEGYVYINNEVIKVDALAGITDSFAGNFEFVPQTNYDANGTKTFRNGILRQTWEQRRAIPTSKAIGTNLNVKTGLRLKDALEQNPSVEEITETTTDYILSCNVMKKGKTTILTGGLIILSLTSIGIIIFTSIVPVPIATTFGIGSNTNAEVCIFRINTDGEFRADTPDTSTTYEFNFSYISE